MSSQSKLFVVTVQAFGGVKRCQTEQGDVFGNPQLVVEADAPEGRIVFADIGVVMDSLQLLVPLSGQFQRQILAFIQGSGELGLDPVLGLLIESKTRCCVGFIAERRSIEASVHVAIDRVRTNEGIEMDASFQASQCGDAIAVDRLDSLPG